MPPAFILGGSQVSGASRGEGRRLTADLTAYRCIGKVQKPHGIRGEFFVFLESDFPRWVASRKTLHALLDGELVTWSVTSTRFHHGRLLMKVDGLPGRNEVEAARDVALYVAEEEAREASEDPDYFYNSDLIGLSVRDHTSDKVYGSVVDVIEMPAQNLLEVEADAGNRFLVPFIAAMIEDVDLDTETIRVNLPEGLAEL